MWHEEEEPATPWARLAPWRQAPTFEAAADALLQTALAALPAPADRLQEARDQAEEVVREAWDALETALAHLDHLPTHQAWTLLLTPFGATHLQGLLDPEEGGSHAPAS